MNTLCRKAKLSFIAMCIGWAACNVTAWVAGAIYAALASISFISGAWVFGIFAIASGIVIAGVWLLIFLPVDLIVSDTSFLRKPTTAALAGMASAVAFTIIHLGVVMATSESFDFVQVLLPELLFTGVTGSVAAYARCRLEIKKSPHTP